ELVRYLIRERTGQTVAIVGRKQSDASPDNGFAVTVGLPCDADTGLHNDGLGVVENIRLGLERGVVGNADSALVGGGTERYICQNEAVFNTARVQIFFKAETICQLDVFGQGPFIRDIKI